MADPRKRIATAEKQRQALELRKAGVTYAVIAERLGWKTADGAHKAVMTALRKTLQEPADAVRKLELERLDSMLLALATQVKNGNQGAIDRALRIMDMRAKLLGTYAPVRQDITTLGESLDIGAWMTDRKKRIEEASGLEEVE
jgi:hypothetical protein